MVRIELLVCLNQQAHLQYDIREVTPSGSPLLKGPPEAGEYLIFCIGPRKDPPVVTVIMFPLIKTP